LAFWPVEPSNSRTVKTLKYAAPTDLLMMAS
jgi:hypothetical protein